MAKCHKGNARYKRKKKRVKFVNDFYTREKELNRMINDFVKSYKSLSYPPAVDEYDIMDKKRLEIKRLLSLQDGELWKQSHRRKRFYYKQLSRFKYHYSAWKRYTYYIFLYKRYGMPIRFFYPLSFFKKVSHNINYTVFTF